MAVECKAEAVKFASIRSPPVKLFDTLATVLSQPMGAGARPNPGADIFICGPPCTPFSGQRNKRYSHGCASCMHSLNSQVQVTYVLEP
eukprot:6089752-Amphidinium_carterae.1